MDCKILISRQFRQVRPLFVKRFLSNNCENSPQIHFGEYKKMNALIGPSLLACDMSNLASESIRVLEAGADFLHIDVMDGHFVPNLTLGAPIISCLRKNVPHAVFDVHLMVTHPERWVEDMAAAGSTIFTFHLEVELDEAAKKLLIRKIKEHGMRAGISIKPGTPVEACLPFLDDVDLVLIMTVEPGFGGQKFMANMMQKVCFLLVTRVPFLCNSPL